MDIYFQRRFNTLKVIHQDLNGIADIFQTIFSNILLHILKCIKWRKFFNIFWWKFSKIVSKGLVIVSKCIVMYIIIGYSELAPDMLSSFVLTNNVLLPDLNALTVPNQCGSGADAHFWIFLFIRQPGLSIRPILDFRWNFRIWNTYNWTEYHANSGCKARTT